MYELQDNVAIVTGGAGGIGAATVKKFLNEGAKVLPVELKQSDVDATVARLESPNLRGFAADVSRADQTKAYLQAAVTAFGGLDILYANAGVEGLVRPLFDSPRRGVRSRLGHRGGGSIVVTASIAGLVGSPGMTAYITSKHALLGLGKVAASTGGVFLCDGGFVAH